MLSLQTIPERIDGVGLARVFIVGALFALTVAMLILSLIFGITHVQNKLPICTFLVLAGAFGGSLCYLYRRWF